MDVLFLGGPLHHQIWADQRNDLTQVKTPQRGPEPEFVGSFWDADTKPPLGDLLEVTTYQRPLSTNLTDELVRQHTGLTIFRLVGTPS